MPRGRIAVLGCDIIFALGKENQGGGVDWHKPVDHSDVGVTLCSSVCHTPRLEIIGLTVSQVPLLHIPAVGSLRISLFIQAR